MLTLWTPFFSFKTLNSLTVTTFFSFQKWRRPLGSFHHFIVQWHYRHPIFYHYQSSSDLFGLQSGRWGGHGNPSFSLSHSAQRIFLRYALWTVSFDANPKQSIFLTFPAEFWIPVTFTNVNYNCSNIWEPSRNEFEKYSVSKIGLTFHCSNKLL